MMVTRYDKRRRHKSNRRIRGVRDVVDPTEYLLGCLFLLAILSVHVVLHLMSDLRVWFESQVLVMQMLNRLCIPELGNRITLIKDIIVLLQILTKL